MKEMTVEDIDKIEADIEHAVRREREALDRERQRIAQYNGLVAENAAAGGDTESGYPESIESLFNRAVDALRRARQDHFRKALNEQIRPSLDARWAKFAEAYRTAVAEADELRGFHAAAQRAAAANGSNIYPLHLPEDGISGRLLDNWSVQSGYQPAVAAAAPVRPRPLTLSEILKRVLGTA